MTSGGLDGVLLVSDVGSGSPIIAPNTSIENAARLRSTLEKVCSTGARIVSHMYTSTTPHAWGHPLSMLAGVLNAASMHATQPLALHPHLHTYTRRTSSGVGRRHSRASKLTIFPEERQRAPAMSDSGRGKSDSTALEGIERTFEGARPVSFVSGEPSSAQSCRGSPRYRPASDERCTRRLRTWPLTSR